MATSAMLRGSHVLTAGPCHAAHPDASQSHGGSSIASSSERLVQTPLMRRSCQESRVPRRGKIRSVANEEPVATEAKPRRSGLKMARRNLLLGAAAGSIICPICDAKGKGVAQAADWTYGDLSGPIQWGGMCSAGTAQSPIDIPPLAAKHELSSTLEFQYKPTGASFLNTGHGTMQVNFPRGSNMLRIDEREVELVQYHFHAPSEHSINGARSAMEAHLVHRDLSTGGLLVVGVLIDGNNSPENLNLKGALLLSPDEPGAQILPISCTLKMDLEPGCKPVLVNPMGLLPSPDLGQSWSYYNYRGSLTTPPCSEGVDWYLLTKKLMVPHMEIVEFMRYVGGRRSLGLNSRPIQKTGNREVLSYP